VKATWYYKVLAQSANTKVIEGNHYFPPESVNKEHLRESDFTTTCPWKGIASYYDIVVGESSLKNGAWYYHEPKPAAGEVKDYVAFARNKGVAISE
jgi:uncharacterized protein (DUF427 family)